MNGYRFCIQKDVYHNDTFVWNLQRFVTVQAYTEKDAKERVGPLEKGKETPVYSGLVIKTSDEYVTQYIQYLGEAKWTCHWEYEKE